MNNSIMDQPSTKQDIENLRHELIGKMATKDELKKLELVTKEEIKKLATREEIKKLATKEEIKKLATKEEIKKLATREEIKKLATREEIKKLATKEEIKKLATKEEMKKLATKEEIKKLATRDELKKLKSLTEEKFNKVDKRLDKLSSAVSQIQYQMTLFETKEESDRKFNILLTAPTLLKHRKQGNIPLFYHHHLPI